MNMYEHANELLRQFKGDSYLYGEGVLDRCGEAVARAGRRALLVRGGFPGSNAHTAAIQAAITGAGGKVIAEARGARPNAPQEDVLRLAEFFAAHDADVIVSFGGGSTIDAAKAAEVLRALGGPIDAWFGVGQVSAALTQQGRRLRPHVAIQSAASSAAHLTKYSNITDLASGQKKLIVDEAIVPPAAIFDYTVNLGADSTLTTDGALDGVSHCLEVLYGAVGKPGYDRIEEIAIAGIRLIVSSLPCALRDRQNADANRGLCLGTDLGGYAIMVGGTNGGHLTSFSLVDILSHGRACALLNPYYTVFFAPAIERPLQAVARVYREAGYTRANVESLNGRDLGLAVAEAMFRLAETAGFPTRLEGVPGFTDAHIERAIAAAKEPQLKMKLENMPVPLRADTIDTYMRPILEAAKTGDLSRIRNMS